MAIAYSYIRFSSVRQADGDSVRRQRENRDAWLAAHSDIRLDTSLALTDFAKSGFKRKDWDSYALAKFVKAVESGVVPRGSYLLIENLDRLSREAVGVATELFLSIVNRGVHIVQLSPVTMEFSHPIDAMKLLVAIMELRRGNSESEIKSARGLKAWEEKHKKAREEREPVAKRHLPGWIRYNESAKKLELIPDRAAVVARIFEQCIAGFGRTHIAAALNADGIPVMGRKQIAIKGQAGLKPHEKKYHQISKWNESMIWSVLTSPATHGEYRPTKEDDSGKWLPVKGAEVPDYFPPAVDRKTFDAAAGSLASRRKGRMAGRRGKHVNLFAGLLVDARDGGSLTYRHIKGRKSVIFPVQVARRGGVPCSQFPAQPFDELIVSALTEINVADVMSVTDHAKEVAALSGRIARLDDQIRMWTAQMDGAADEATVNLITEKLNGWHATRRALVLELADLQRQGANPVAEAWGQVKSLACLLKTDPSDEMRTKLKAALRATIESVTCLFSVRSTGWVRTALVHVLFKTGRSRDYMLAFEPARETKSAKRPGFAHAQTWVADDGDGIVLCAPPEPTAPEPYWKNWNKVIAVYDDILVDWAELYRTGKINMTSLS